MTANDRRRWPYQDSPESGNGAKRKPSLDILSFRFCPRSRPSPRQSASA